jgi:preprotein translocase subunit SecF
MKEKFQKKIGSFHDKHYKKILLIPLLILIASIVFIAFFYSANGDFIYKDVSLTGGTSVTIYDKLDISTLEADLSSQLEDVNVRQSYDIITQEQLDIIIETKTGSEETKEVLEAYLGYELVDGVNSGFEFTGATLSQSFFNQLLKALVLALFFMSLVVFLIFGESKKTKSFAAALTLLGAKLTFPHIGFLTALIIILLIASFVLMLMYAKSKKDYLMVLALLIGSIVIFIYPSYLFIILIALILIPIYILTSVPSFAVISSVIADIIMTLAFFDIIGLRMSTAGIVAFLMLIGYSVDTDILLTTRIMRRQEGTLNSRIAQAFNTGITMTLTSLLAILIALFVVKSFSAVLAQIFTVLAIGLAFDILNTWITNVSMLKWYVERKK